MLTVHNKNSFDFEGRYNGRDYLFPAGKVTAVPDDAARHIFGVGLESKHEVMVRHGWVRTSDGHQRGLDILNRFSFNVADQLQPGEIIEAAAEIVEPEPVVTKEEPEQGSAPLQTGSGGDSDVSDGSDEEPPQPTKPDKSKGGSILETLGSLGE